MRTAVIIGMALIMAGAGLALGRGLGVPGGRGRGAPPAATAPSAAPDAPAKPMEARTDVSVTTHNLQGALGGEVAYTAIAGYMPLKDERDRLRANMFYVSYTKGTQPIGTGVAAGNELVNQVTTTPSTAPGIVASPERRPITFIFNGGPGAAAVWLHLGIGPRRIDMAADGMPPKAPFRLVENSSTWLPATDMVFIDPVNTGYSRAANPEEAAREFFGVQEDISSVGEFIRLYMTKYQRWGSPVFIAGESYGTTRAAALANYLQGRVGVSVSGVILISTVLNFATLSPGENNDLPYALFLPSYTAVAAYHKKIPLPGGGLEALLKDSENFAVADYTVALTKGAALAVEERSRVAKKLAGLTGLSEQYVLQSNLRILPARFEKELLRGSPEEGKVLGRFDGRVIGWPVDPVDDRQDYDPSLSGYYAAYTSAFSDYARRVLKFESDFSYEVLSSRVQPWNYASGGATNSYLYVGDDLRDAMTQNPQMKLLVCSGWYDLATPYFATEYTLNHLGVSPEIRKNITHAYYPGGHMMYHVHAAQEKLGRDVMGFYEAAAR